MFDTMKIQSGGLVYSTQELGEILLYNDLDFIESSSIMSAYSKEHEKFRLEEMPIGTFSRGKPKELQAIEVLPMDNAREFSRHVCKL